MDSARGLLSIDLQALVQNYAFLRQRVGKTCAVATVVKADSYGCGMGRVAPALYSAGARVFFVASAEEGAALRTVLAGPSAEIYVLNGFFACDRAVFQDNALIPVLNSLEQIDAYRALAQRMSAVLPAALHFDTGMNRLGLEAREAAQITDSPALLERLDVRMVMSHFACADEPAHPMNAGQHAQFLHYAAHFPKALKSLANSSGIFASGDYHLDMVRPGMALYGLNPAPEQNNPMHGVVKLEVPVLQLRTAKKGQTCGYGATYRFENKTPLAVVGAGYADGVFRHLSNRGELFWQGYACPIRGRVSMDSVIVDLSAVPEDQRPHAGDMFEVIGPHQSADALAAKAGTIGYEILTALGPRYKRVYLERSAKRISGGKSASESGA
ncbi:MAG: alanine racemase [Alphaproteobacteria bacterium]|nr:alanine racemase [Alphaproteobacteria bacterium]